MKKILILFVALAFLAGLAGDAQAQKRRKRRPKMPDKTVVDFTAITIDGKLKRPIGAFILEHRDRAFDKLLDINESFLEQVVRAADEL